MSNLLKKWREGEKVVIQFTRPELRNPLSVEVLAGLETMIAHLEDAEAVVFAGTDGVFASGADLREIRELSGQSAKEFARRGQKLFCLIERIQQRTIAAIDGPCFGGALDLVLACDQRIASTNSSFCHPGAGLGIITGWGGTQKLPRLIGEAWALEMFFTAAAIPASRALSIGLIDQVAEDPLAAALSS